MVSDPHWFFIQEKYSLVDYLDSAIVISRFNQKELLRELIEIRSKLLETDIFSQFSPILDHLLEIDEKVEDQRLSKVLSILINRLSELTKSSINFEKNIRPSETKVSD
ncbi:MAG: hypothetical protein GF308_20785 [Candidatus Heimdallarchaeota archaeon]|nr:hypothetical protein [Candidatus Heimdallarchaeota archaeon]